MTDFSTELREAREGDEDALLRILEHAAPRLNGVLRAHMNSLVRRRYDTADLRQSIFVEVLRDLPRFEDRGEEAFRHWLDVKARNKVRMKFRRLLGPAGGRREETLEDGESCQSEEKSPLEGAERNEETEKVLGALRGLEMRDRDVIRLRCAETLSFSEVAEWMDLPSADAARKLYARALMKLRSLLITG